jgi:hypothetical protein
MSRSFGRIRVDDEGIRLKPILFFFGSQFDLKWSDITGWATAEAVLASDRTQEVIARILELHLAKGMETVNWSGSGKTFDSLVEEVRRRLPDKRVESVMKQMSPMYR